MLKFENNVPTPIQRLTNETEELLIQRYQLVQQELELLKLELDTQRKRIVILQKTNRLLMASETQLRKDLMNIADTKNQRIAELEEEIAHQLKRNQMYPHHMEEQATCRPNSKSFPERKLEADFPDVDIEQIPDAVEQYTSQFSTRNSEKDFVVISEDIEQTEFKDRLILTKISSRDYGRVVGRQGKNARRLENEYGVKITFSNRNQEALKLIISEGDVNSRRAAAEDVIKNLPVTVECPQIEILNSQMRWISYQCEVEISRSGSNDNVTIFGRMNNCRLAYKKLLEE